MIVDRLNKIGLFEKGLSFNDKGLFFFDFQHNNKIILEDYVEWKPIAISSDGKYCALVINCEHKGKSRTELRVIHIEQMKIIFSTKDYLTHNVSFDSSGDYLLVDAFDKKALCIHLPSKKKLAEISSPLKILRGDLDMVDNKFYVPHENEKNTLLIFNFKTKKHLEKKLKVEGKIKRIKFSTNYQNLYLITEENILYCLNRDLSTLWQKDFSYLGEKGGRIWPSRIFISEDDTLLCLSAVETEENNFGADYVIDASGGELVRTIEGFQNRGRLAEDYFGTNVLTYRGTILNQQTGDISSEPII